MLKFLTQYYKKPLTILIDTFELRAFTSVNSKKFQILKEKTNFLF